MSSPKYQSEHLKAGHPPAVKAGGMRIKGARAHEEKLSKEDYESPWESKSPKEKAPLTVVSGAVVNKQTCFPPEAIKVAHNKPAPTAVKRPHNPQQNRPIQQPRS